MASHVDVGNRPDMPRILVLLDHYVPGYKSGGPLRTIENLVDRLKDIFEFWIVTRDRDATDTAPYSGIGINKWNAVNGAQVWYAGPGTLTLPNLRRLMLAVEPDAVYLNSFFSSLTLKVLTLRRVRAIPRFPTILAPRGEFSPGALSLKSVKKRPYIFLTSRLGLYDKLLWQASSDLEEQELTAVWPKQIESLVAPNIPAPFKERDTGDPHPETKRVGYARFIFLSRISPKKNLASAIQWLKSLSGGVTLGIYGPIRDEHYWNECRSLFGSLPSNLKIEYYGSVPHDEVLETIAQYHFFLLPTLGENFGHAILEAFVAGRPVLIGDGTPWRDLSEHGVGWEIPPNNSEEWMRVLQQCVDMDAPQYEQMSDEARRFARMFIDSEQIVRSNIAMFERAIQIGDDG